MLIDVRWHIAWIPLLIWVLFFCITSSCSSGIDKKELSNGQKIISHTKETLITEILDSTKINIEEAKKHTLSEAELIFGKPIEKDLFVVDGALPEFRIEIYNFISEEEYTKETIKINEVTWKKNKGFNMTVWYIKKGKHWQYLDALVYHNDAMF